MGLRLRDYQDRIVGKTIDFLEQVRSVLIMSPTGSGKTIIGLEAAKRLGNVRVAWVSHRREILRQAVETNDKFFGLDLIPVSMYSTPKIKADVIISDECHHDCVDSMSTIYGLIKPEKIIGLTATDYRLDRIGLNFEKRISDIGIRELIRLGYLSKYDHYTLPEFTPEMIAKVYDREYFGQSVVFFNNGRDCNLAAKLLSARGFKCEVVSHHSDRGDQLDRFKNKEVDVLLSIRVLTEGFDCPQIESIFVRDSGKSPTVQMGPYPEFKKKKLIQSRHTRYMFTRHADPEDLLVWDKKWKSIVPPDVEPMITSQRKILSQTVVEKIELPQKQRFKGEYRE